MEENIEIICNHLERENKGITCLVRRLGSSVLHANHVCGNCMSYRKTLSTFSAIIKVVATCDKREIQEILPVIDDILQMCFEVLCGLNDGKDLCLPILCDIMCSSLFLFPSDQIFIQLSVIIRKSKKLLMDLVGENPSLSCEDIHYSSVEFDRLKIHLRIWESVISFLIALNDMPEYSRDNKSYVDVIALLDDEFIKLLLKIIDFGHDILISQLLLCLVPKIMTLTQSNSMIKQIWENIANAFCSLNHNSEMPSCTLLILCALSDYFIPYGYDAHFYPIAQSCDFWKILQYGLVSCNALTRKQALYLLKRAINQETTFNKSLAVSHESGKLFWWNKHNEDFHKVWNDYFLLLEVLEEKQMHLIQPVQPVLFSLYRACSKSLIDSSWILCVLERGLKHDCTTMIKWSIQCFSELQIIPYISKINRSIIFSFLKALNCSSLYVMSSQNSSGPNILHRLTSFFVAIAEEKSVFAQQFFRNLLNCIVQITWGPVALFYVAFALGAVPKYPFWKLSDVQVLKHFLINALATQVVLIRGAVQSLFIDSLINLGDEKQMELTTLTDLIGAFRRNECMERGTPSWHKVTFWLKSFITEKDAFTFEQKTFDDVINGRIGNKKQATARMIILLSDAGLIDLDFSKSCFKQCSKRSLLALVSYLEDCHIRWYVCPNKRNSSLEMLICMLEESLPIEENDMTGKKIISLIVRILPGMFYCIQNFMLTCSSLEDFDVASLYLRSLSILSKEPKLYLEVLKEARLIQVQLSSSSFCIGDKNSESGTPLSKYFLYKCLSWLSDLIKNANLVCHKDHPVYEEQMRILEGTFLHSNLNVVLIKDKQHTLLTRDLQTLWGRLVSEHMQSMWSLINVYIEIKCRTGSLDVDSEHAQRLLKEAGEALEVGGREILIAVMSVIQRIMHFIILSGAKEELKRFISACWTAVFELRKSDRFWTSMETFISMSFHKSLMEDEEMTTILLEYARTIFIQGQTVAGLGNLLIKKLQELITVCDGFLFDIHAELLVDSLVFGSVHRRDRKIDDDVCTFIKSMGDKFCIEHISDIYVDAEVRARAIAILLACQENSDSKIFLEVYHLLLLRDIQETQQRTRYFADSYHHRFRNRVMQVFLVVEPLLPDKENDKLAAYVCKSLLSENHQPSIRYLQEWLLTRIMYRNCTAHHLIWNVLQAPAKTRPVSLCSFISIVYHVARVLPKGDVSEKFIDRGMNEILPCTMIQHFNVRLYAQVSFCRLWEYADETGYVNITDKYCTIYLCIKPNLCAPSALKNVQKLEDFYFTTFHPLKDYSLQTIFYELPRLTKVADEEWISTALFLSCGAKTNIIPLLNENSKLHDCKCFSSIDKSDCTVDEKISLNIDVANVQKKIIPWKAMVPDPEMVLSESESILGRKKMVIDDGLVVVASLIDRTPNLGGLSRTCEAFGVCQYVIGSIKYVEDKQFQALSVTAERWISITEVKPLELPMYLEKMKGKGYTVVGAEQTANSVLLNEVKFPKKTLLLLGNEKEGIPVTLLPLLDMCVEVPQQGVIRSLNVHVTGAIFIWEYARQHNIKHKL